MSASTTTDRHMFQNPTRHYRPATASRHPATSVYRRSEDLPRLLPLWPHEVADRSPEAQHRLIQRLRRALREERRRGIGGHWTYDLARHAGLRRALQAEIASLPPPLSTWAMPPFRAVADARQHRCPLAQES